jgi:hypothetical protein
MVCGHLSGGGWLAQGEDTAQGGLNLLVKEDSCHSSKLSLQTLGSKAAQVFHKFFIFSYSNQKLLGSGSPDTMGQVTVRAQSM